MLGGLERVGWIVLKSGYNINPYYASEYNLYNLNNDHSNKKTH